MKSSFSPKSFTFSSQGKSTPARVKCFTCSNDFNPTATACYLSGLACIWLESNQSIKVRPSFSKFFFHGVDFPVPVRDCIDICIVADLAIGDKIKKISLIKMLNIRVPRIEPCGTPLITFAPELITLQILTQIASHKPAGTVRYPICLKFFYDQVMGEAAKSL